MRDKKIEIRVNQSEFDIIKEYPEEFENLSEYIRSLLLHPDNDHGPPYDFKEIKAILLDLSQKMDLVVSSINQLNLKHQERRSGTKVKDSLLQYWLANKEQLLQIKDLDELQQFVQFDFQSEVVYDCIEQLEDENKIYITRTGLIKWNI